MLTQIGSVLVVSIKNSETTVEEFRQHIQAILPAANVIKEFSLTKWNGKRVAGKVVLEPTAVDLNQAGKFASQLRQSALNGQPVTAQAEPASNFSNHQQQAGARSSGDRARAENKEDNSNGTVPWQISKAVAKQFFDWLQLGIFDLLDDAKSINLTSVDRDKVTELFVAFTSDYPSLDSLADGISGTEKRQRRRLESLVLSVLKRQKLYKVKRYSDGIVVCSFARPDKCFASFQERQTALDVLRQERQVLTSNKGGIRVTEEPVTKYAEDALMPVNEDVELVLTIEETINVKLMRVRLGGSHKKDFQVKTQLPFDAPCNLILSFRARSTGVYRTTVFLSFLNTQSNERFVILRSVILRAGDANLHNILQPTSPYIKKERKFDKPVNPNDIIYPPAQSGSTGSNYNDLKHNKIPLDVREMVASREMEGVLVPPTYDMSDEELARVYPAFWQNLLWISELQSYEDVKLFDMENTALQRAGRMFKLHVAGLAEGRPSVLRGDQVFCTWKGKQFRGRVCVVELLDVILEFHKDFHNNFNVSLDRVELVRFTFSRTSFRTAHAGCLAAPKTMGSSILVPQSQHVDQIEKLQQQRVLPEEFQWASQTLNDEQKYAVKQITEGTLRPMPYIILGPPGTGKTTTIIEAVYQLARMHMHNPSQPKLKILLVAPSNDATDILVEKLSPYFPPSELMRLLAYTRSIDQCPPLVQPYIRENLQADQAIQEIMTVQIVVTTVSLAARLWCAGKGYDGLQTGWFDVICVDEAGHATEPEVIGASAKLMQFSGQDSGQMVLAGDPKQLGPIITSELCKKMGLGVSLMERVINTSPAYSLDDNDEYTPGLVTLLVRNYRSHPAILKLPNDMFYDNKLKCCGDKITTHSMSNWEHLPNRAAGFPLVFNAVDGENCREGNSPSWFNPQEVISVVETVDLLVNLSKPKIRHDEIGIITPYARQVQKIRLLLKTKDMGDVKVGSVETFQGQERRCIIISTVRSENDLLEHDRKYNLGFVANEKRFNVAVTRAKALLVVIGNPRVLETDKKNWLPLLRYCRDNGSWMGQDWKEGAAAAEDEDEKAMMEGGGTGETDEIGAEVDDGWEVVQDHEACGFINREE